MSVISSEKRIVFVTALVVASLFLGVSVVPLDRSNETTDDLEQEGDMVTKLLFIHHSVGGNWLSHDYGGLVSALNRHGFYVNDITYGWQPSQLNSSWFARANSRLRDLFGVKPQGADRIGNRTDVGHLYDWFIGPDSALVMDAVFRENSETDDYGDHANLNSLTPLANPGTAVVNEVVMIKPCYPNSLYRGNGDDGPASGDRPPRNFRAGAEQHTVANSKRIYNDILQYFASRPDKFFVLVTAPPMAELPNNGQIAREFSNWLARDWLLENNYQVGNVMVFDLFNVLTTGDGLGRNDLSAEGGNHHRLRDGREEHLISRDNNLLVYPRKDGDSHPSPAGLQKATEEFVALFLHHYRNWKG